MLPWYEKMAMASSAVTTARSLLEGWKVTKLIAEGSDSLKADMGGGTTPCLMGVINKSAGEKKIIDDKIKPWILQEMP